MIVEYITSGSDLGPILSITSDEKSEYTSLIEVCQRLQDGKVDSVDLRHVLPSTEWRITPLLFVKSSQDVGVRIGIEGGMEVCLTPATWADVKLKLDYFLTLDIQRKDCFNWLAGPQSDNTPTQSDITLLISTRGGW